MCYYTLLHPVLYVFTCTCFCGVQPSTWSTYGLKKQITIKCILLCSTCEATNYYYDCYFYQYYQLFFFVWPWRQKKWKVSFLKEVRGNFGKGKGPKEVIKSMYHLIHGMHKVLTIKSLFYQFKIMFITFNCAYTKQKRIHLATLSKLVNSAWLVIKNWFPMGSCVCCNKQLCFLYCTNLFLWNNLQWKWIKKRN